MQSYSLFLYSGDLSHIIISVIVPFTKSSISETEPVSTVLSSPAVRQLESAMSVKIHYADHLYPTLHLLHPLVRIHVLDYKTAKPLPSTLGDARYSTIQPLLTEPFDLRVNKTMSPCWEEQVLIPEQYESIISNDNAMLFFEVRGFSNFIACCPSYASFILELHGIFLQEFQINVLI